jgi:tetratricopeptide (TPR) repeat protein
MDEMGKAMSFLTNGINKYPDFMDLYLYRARLNESQHRYEDAQEDYETVLKTKKNNPEVLLSYAICLKKLNQTSKALSTLNNAFYNDKTG